VDSAWEQEKPEVRKMPVSRDESHQSAARFVRRTLTYRMFPENKNLTKEHFLLDTSYVNIYLEIVLIYKTLKLIGWSNLTFT
jgi:hypothetical protein